MNRILTLAAIVEAVTGVALIINPSLVTELLLGAEISGAAVAVGRFAGIGLFALGLACWPIRNVACRRTAAGLAMLTYNSLITCYLIFLGIGGQSVGILLWPAAAIHGVLTFLLIRKWFKTEKIQVAKGSSHDFTNSTSNGCGGNHGDLAGQRGRSMARHGPRPSGR
jgi:hypothetical protein